MRILYIEWFDFVNVFTSRDANQKRERKIVMLIHVLRLFLIWMFSVIYMYVYICI